MAVFSQLYLAVSMSWGFEAQRFRDTQIGNLYGYDELGTIASLGCHELRVRLVPSRDLDHATV